MRIFIDNDGCPRGFCALCAQKFRPAGFFKPPKRGRILAVFEPRSNTMKLGSMKAQLPWSLEEADLAFCYSGGLDWDAAQALAPMGKQAIVCDSIDTLVTQIVAHARPGDHVLCMSNGGFGGVHAKLLAELAARSRPAG